MKDNKKFAKQLLRAATQLAKVTAQTKEAALYILVKSLADHKGLTRDKG